MKVTRQSEPKFIPVVITLETQEEVKMNDIPSWTVEDRYGIVKVVDKEYYDALNAAFEERCSEVCELKKRVKFLESDAILQLEKKLEDKRLAAKIVYEWLGKFADHETSGKSWCGWLDDSYGTVYRIWKE